MKKYSLQFTVFFVGAAVMILELVGSRILAPYLGSSLVVWTGLIGVIMASLAAGYWYGGNQADRKASLQGLSMIVFLAGATIGITTMVQKPFLQGINISTIDLRLMAFVAALILFALPSFLAGMVSPYTVRLALNDLGKSGRTVGNLYALSTAGSIVGTFAAGFWLIPYFGSVRILIILSITLILYAILLGGRHLIGLKIILIVTMFIGLIQPLLDKNTLFDGDSLYNRIIVKEDSSQSMLYLATDAQSVQSMAAKGSDELVTPYIRHYRLAEFFAPKTQTALMIGGGAYTYPKDFLKRFPEARMDVVEIDEKMTKLARQYFGLKADSRLNITHQDGRSFLNRNDKQYDVIFVDAFKSITPPFELATRESYREINKSLSSDGVLLINIVSSIEGNKGMFFRSSYRTLSEVFPKVYVFPVHSSDGEKFQNLMVVALKNDKNISLKSDNQEIKGYLDKLWTKDILKDKPILTDDYAPVEYYLSKAIQS